MPKLTLAQIANEYNRTPRVFARLVRELNIPHELLKNSMLFDPIAVSKHLANRAAIEAAKSNVVKFAPTVRKSEAKKSRFAMEVGI